MALRLWSAVGYDSPVRGTAIHGVQPQVVWAERQSHPRGA